MKVTELTNEGLKKEFNVVIAAHDVAVKINENVKKVGKDVKIQGFRPGKVPANLIKQRYKQTIMSNVLDELVKQNSQKLFKERNLTPAMQPNIEVIKFEENEDLEFKLSMEVFPEVKFPDFAIISLDKIVCELSDQDVLDALDKVSKANKQFEKSSKEKAENGDAVIIDFEGKIDGVAFAGGASKGHQLELGSKQFIDNFEQQLVGSKVGDKKLVKVKFPEDYGSAELAGKPAEFDVEVKEILTSSSPLVDDEFAKKFGLANLEELKVKIREQIQKDCETASKAKMRKELFDSLEKLCNFEVPEGMVDQEFNGLWEKALELKKSNPNFSNKPEEELRNVYLKMSKRRVLLGILLAEIAKENNVVIGQDEIRQAVYEQARNYPGQEHAVLDYYRNNPQALEYLKGPIMEDKAVDIVLEKVQTNDKNVSLKDFPEAVKISEDEL